MGHTAIVPYRHALQELLTPTCRVRYYRKQRSASQTRRPHQIAADHFMPHRQLSAMILAAGRGERLRPLTDTVPKPLLQVGAHRLIDYHLYALAHGGITQVVINVSHLADEIITALGNGSRYGVSIRYSKEPVGALETGGGIRQALSLIESDPFIVINSDIWTNLQLEDLPGQVEHLAHLVLVDNPAHHSRGDFFLCGHRVSKVAEHAARRLTFAGVGVYRHALFNDTTPGRFALAPLLATAMAQGKVSGQHFAGCWLDVGDPARLSEARARVGITQTQKKTTSA